VEPAVHQRGKLRRLGDGPIWVSSATPQTGTASSNWRKIERRFTLARPFMCGKDSNRRTAVVTLWRKEDWLSAANSSRDRRLAKGNGFLPAPSRKCVQTTRACLFGAMAVLSPPVANFIKAEGLRYGRKRHDQWLMPGRGLRRAGSCLMGSFRAESHPPESTQVGGPLHGPRCRYHCRDRGSRPTITGATEVMCSRPATSVLIDKLAR